MLEELLHADPETAAAVAREIVRQNDHLELIASENFVSPAVLEAAGSVLTNKYAEGYPGKRYYGGCIHVDEVEDLARARARTLFGAQHANVQPHSGSQANMAVYMAFLKPGDTILGLDLAHGGHLTHGHPLSFSGMYFKVAGYQVDRETERIDYGRLAELAKEHRPRMMIAGASAYPRRLDFEAMGRIARDCGALLMVDMAHIAGLVAAGLHPSPVPHADVVTTTTHKTLRGPRGGMILCREEHAKAIDKALFPGVQGGPLMHIVAAKAVALKEAGEPSFRAYQEKVVRNAAHLSAAVQREGLRIVAGGTDTHLFLADVTGAGLNGKEAERALDAAGITVNKNTIPFDPLPPLKASGIRIGTPAVTTRGMAEPELDQIGAWIGRALRGAKEEATLAGVRAEVAALCAQYPLYPKGLGEARALAGRHS